MKTLLTIISCALFIGVGRANHPANGPVLLFYKGAMIQALQLETGLIRYYESNEREAQLSSSGIHSFHREEVTVQRSFIGVGDEVEEITAYNYKELIIKYLPHAPELHKRLGKPGFRFPNVRYMVQFYNRFKAGGAESKTAI